MSPPKSQVRPSTAALVSGASPEYRAKPRSELLGAPAPSIRIRNRARSRRVVSTPRGYACPKTMARVFAWWSTTCTNPRPSAPGKALRSAVRARVSTRGPAPWLRAGAEYSPGPHSSRRRGGTGGFAGGLGMRLRGVGLLRSLRSGGSAAHGAAVKLP